MDDIDILLVGLLMTNRALIKIILWAGAQLENNKYSYNARQMLTSWMDCIVH